MIYLDHAATTPMRPEVWDAMQPFALDVFGNSSGVHSVSRRAKNALEESRERVASLIGAQPMEIVFTSGGTESDNLALKGVVWNTSSRNGVVSVATEHEAVLETMDLLRRHDPCGGRQQWVRSFRRHAGSNHRNDGSGFRHVGE